MQLNSKDVNINQCLHAQQLHSFQNPICTVFFVLLTATCFSGCMQGGYDAINSHLTQMLMCATVNVKPVLLDFFYLCISNYQLSMW